MLRLNREQRREALQSIPRDHDIVLRGIAEVGRQNLYGLRLGYIHTQKSKREKFIQDLKDLIKEIQSGEFEEEEQ